MKIAVDIERMKYPFTGLYSYCQQLAEALMREQAPSFVFYCPSTVVLPDGFVRYNLNPLHKLQLRLPKEIDLWHATHQSTAYWPSTNQRVILTVHDLNFLQRDLSTQKKNRYLKKLKVKIDKADAIVAISNFTMKSLEQHFDLSAKKSVVIHNGVALKTNEDLVLGRKLKKERYFFYVGTILPKKNIHELLKILKFYPDHKLYLAGIQSDAKYLSRIKTLTMDLGIQHQVKLLGPISEAQKYTYLKYSAAFLFPSLAEGFGLPVVEAMLLGKPVFISTEGSLPEVGGDFAYYFRNFEQEHMQEVLQKGLEDYQQGQKATKIIEWANQFSWEKAAKAYIQLYKEVLALD